MRGNMPNELPDPNAGANLNAISSLNTPSSLPSGTSATDVAAPNFVDPNIQPNSPPPAIPSPVTSPPLVAQSTTPYQANVQPPINPNSNFASALTPASLTEPGDSLQNQDDQQSADGQTNNEFGQPEVENLGFVAKASNYISTLSANFISAFNNNQRLFTLVGTMK